MIIGEPASLWTSGAVVYICYNNRHVLYDVLQNTHTPLRHSRMSLTVCQSTPAIGDAFQRPVGTLYQLQRSFHTQSTEPEPTARARRAGKEFYSTTPEFMFVSFRLLVVESI